jgi:hypothetical protein
MDYGRPVQFGCFIIPESAQPRRALGLASLVVELGFDTLVVGEGDLLRVADEVIPRVRELVAAGRETR